MSEAYEAAMHTLRTCRRRAIHPEQAGCYSVREQRMFWSGILDHMQGMIDKLPMTPVERDAIFDRVCEASRLIYWLMEIDDVLAGRREPRWIGRGPREVRRWQSTFAAGHTCKTTDITRGVKP